jgi:hypothetical protein
MNNFLLIGLIVFVVLGCILWLIRALIKSQSEKHEIKEEAGLFVNEKGELVPTITVTFKQVS